VLEVPTLSLTCDVSDPVTGQRYSRDPRYVAQKAEQYLVKSGSPRPRYYGPERSFTFHSVRFDQNAHEGYYHIDSERDLELGDERQPEHGAPAAHKEGYFPVPPVDRLQDLRSKIMLALMASGVDVEVHHHEVVRRADRDRHAVRDAGAHADQLMMYKYIVKNVCHQNGYTRLSCQADVRDNGSDACAYESVEGRDEPVLPTQRVRAAVGHGALYIGG